MDWNEILDIEYRRIFLKERKLKGHAFTDCIQKSIKEFVKAYLKFKKRGIEFKPTQLYNLFLRFNPCGFVSWGSFRYHFHKMLEELTQNPPKDEEINDKTPAVIELKTPKEEKITLNNPLRDTQKIQKPKEVSKSNHKAVEEIKVIPKKRIAKRPFAHYTDPDAVEPLKDSWSPLEQRARELYDSWKGKASSEWDWEEIKSLAKKNRWLAIRLLMALYISAPKEPSVQERGMLIREFGIPAEETTMWIKFRHRLYDEPLYDPFAWRERKLNVEEGSDIPDVFWDIEELHDPLFYDLQFNFHIKEIFKEIKKFCIELGKEDRLWKPPKWNF